MHAGRVFGPPGKAATTSQIDAEPITRSQSVDRGLEHAPIGREQGERLNSPAAAVRVY